MDEPIYRLDNAKIRAIRPDVILAQDLCRVCAVPSGAVQDALDVIGCRAHVISLDPNRLDDVINCIGRGRPSHRNEVDGRDLMARLRQRLTQYAAGSRDVLGRESSFSSGRILRSTPVTGFQTWSRRPGASPCSRQQVSRRTV